jgi:hypothetical protein
MFPQPFDGPVAGVGQPLIQHLSRFFTPVQLHLYLGEIGTQAQLNAGKGGFHTGHLLTGQGFGQAEGGDGLHPAVHGRVALQCIDGRDNMRIQHPLHLIGHARQKEKPARFDRQGKPGAVPTGLCRIVLPCGSMACFRLDAVMGRLNFLKKLSTFARASSSNTSFTPAAPAAASADRSSLVGPSPPVTTATSTRRATSRKVDTNVAKSSPRWCGATPRCRFPPIARQYRPSCCPPGRRI